jgi:hypothetical protein
MKKIEEPVECHICKTIGKPKWEYMLEKSRAIILGPKSATTGEHLYKHKVHKKSTMDKFYKIHSEQVTNPLWKEKWDGLVKASTPESIEKVQPASLSQAVDDAIRNGADVTITIHFKGKQRE